MTLKPLPDELPPPIAQALDARLAELREATGHLMPDAALAQRAGAFRQLAEQHGLVAAEVKALRDDLQAARDEADSLRERAALVDALRAELAQFQNDETPRSEDQSALLAARDNQIAVLKAECDGLRSELAAARAAAKSVPVGETGGEVAALKAELTAAKASQDEMQAFQSGLAARLEATMARLRQALDSQAQH